MADIDEASLHAIMDDVYADMNKLFVDCGEKMKAHVDDPYMLVLSTIKMMRIIFARVDLEGREALRKSAGFDLYGEMEKTMERETDTDGMTAQ